MTANMLPHGLKRDFRIPARAGPFGGLLRQPEGCSAQRKEVETCLESDCFCAR